MPIDTRHPREIRQDIRRGKLAGITAGLGQNYVQANLAVLPKEQAYDFLLFCQRNPRPCPLLEVTDVGSPEHVGDPGAIGIADIARPDWGDAQEFARGDVPVFWACGVTPQAVALASRPTFMITHSPGHMFITDLPNSALAAI